MSLLGMIASELPNPHRILPCLRGLAANHLGRNFNKGQLRTVRGILIGAVRQCLGRRFDAALEVAWYRVTEALIDQMAEADQAPAGRLRLVAAC